MADVNLGEIRDMPHTGIKPLDLSELREEDVCDFSDAEMFQLRGLLWLQNYHKAKDGKQLVCRHGIAELACGICRTEVHPST